MKSRSTLAQTESTRGGPQHPAYDIQLVGTGDLVMTDIRQTSATLSVEGRFDFVRERLGIGEQTAGEVSQDLWALQGKILRVAPDGSIPVDNPFYRKKLCIKRVSQKPLERFCQSIPSFSNRLCDTHL